MPTVSAGNPILATVATTGDYNDLLNKPAGNVLPLDEAGRWTGTDSGATAGMIHVERNAQPYLAGFTGVALYGPEDADALDRQAYLDNVAVGCRVVLWVDQNTYGIYEVTAVSEVGGVYTITFTALVAIGDWPGNGTVCYFGITGAPPLPTLATVATTGDYGDLSNRPDLSVYALASSLAIVATSGNYSDLSGAPTNLSSFSNDVGYITSAGLAAVATSGAYADLSGAPTLGTIAAQDIGTTEDYTVMGADGSTPTTLHFQNGIYLGHS